MSQTLWTVAANALVAALESVGNPGAPVYRARYDAIPQSASAYNLFPNTIEMQNDDSRAAMSVKATFMLRAYIGVLTGVDVAIDPYLAWAWQAITKDPTLGGVALDTRIQRIEYSYIGDTGADQVCADLTLEVTLSVSRSDPTLTGMEN